MGKLVIDGNSVYEIDENCIRKKENRSHKNNEEQEKKNKKETKKYKY